MLADLDLLLISVFCAADDFLPEPAKNAKRILTDAEVVTLAVAQAIMGITSDARFIRTARKQLVHLFPVVPNRVGYLKRRQRLSDTIEWLMGGVRQRQSRLLRRPGAGRLDPGRVRPQRRDDAPQPARRRRRLRLLREPQPLLLGLSPARPVRARRHPARADADLAKDTRTRRLPQPALPLPAIRPPVRGRRQRLRRPRVRNPGGTDATIIRPRRKDEPARGPHLAPIRQRVESIFQTCKDLLTLERHGARTLHGLATRINIRFLALTAAIALNHHLARPPRALTDYTA
jgi:hypothetical protein